MNILEIQLASIAFGELDISNKMAIFLLTISVFVFLAVGISSFKLIQSAFDSDEEADK